MVTRENLENMLQGEVHLEQPSLDPPPSSSCPNLLIRSQNLLFLQNTNMPKSATNPMVFQNLDEYLLYLKSQRKQNIRCPVLFLQEETNTQGQNVYRMRPSPISMEGGGQVIMAEDGSRDNPPYNQDQYAGFDPYGFNVGQQTNIDQIHQSTEKNNRVSDNPMDTNWGGTTYSQESVDSGKYADREVGKPTLVPRVVEIYK